MQAPPPDRHRSRAGERRHLTVMFCDLVDSTRLAEALDPEDWREIVSSYHHACEVVVHRFDGSVAERLGDGLVGYFGWPVAHENDAYRAVRSALSVIDAMATLNVQLERRHAVRLQVRIGIDTGTVVIGEMSDGQNEERATGSAVNVAARLQNLASPDAVVVSGATFELVRGYVAYEDLGPQQLRSMAKAVHVYRVVADRGVADSHPRPQCATRPPRAEAARAGFRAVRHGADHRQPVVAAAAGSLPAPALSAPQLRRQTLGVVVSWLIREAEHKHRPASAPARWASDSRLALSRPSCCE